MGVNWTSPALRQTNANYWGAQGENELIQRSLWHTVV